MLSNENATPAKTTKTSVKPRHLTDGASIPVPDGVFFPVTDGRHFSRVSDVSHFEVRDGPPLNSASSTPAAVFPIQKTRQTIEPPAAIPTPMQPAAFPLPSLPAAIQSPAGIPLPSLPAPIPPPAGIPPPKTHAASLWVSQPKKHHPLTTAFQFRPSAQGLQQTILLQPQPQLQQQQQQQQLKWNDPRIHPSFRPNESAPVSGIFLKTAAGPSSFTATTAVTPPQGFPPVSPPPSPPPLLLSPPPRLPSLPPTVPSSPSPRSAGPVLSHPHLPSLTNQASKSLPFSTSPPSFPLLLPPPPPPPPPPPRPETPP